MASTKLPYTLLDLVSAKLNGPLPQSRLRHGIKPARFQRNAHAVAFKTQVQLQPGYLAIPRSQSSDRSLYGLKPQRKPELPVVEERAPGPISELERRVNALKEAAATEEEVLDSSIYSEQELLAVYEDILAIPQEEQVPSEVVLSLTEESDAVTAENVRQRILASEDSLDSEEEFSSFASRLRGRQPHQLQHIATNAAPEAVESSSWFSSLMHRLDKILSELEVVRSLGTNLKDAKRHGDGSPVSNQFVPVGMIAESEWAALARHAARIGDDTDGERILFLMQRSSMPISEDTLNGVLDIYAQAGNVTATERLLRNFIVDRPSEDQRDIHIKAHLKGVPNAILPTTALSLLHQYENQAIPAPQQSYTRVITHLFSKHTSVAHAHAWDLFSHMRYAAHSKPDALLYTLMIRACALPSFSNGVEPERALDLFHEMTVDQKIPPTTGTYSAVITACARSGEEKYVHEGFRLAKQMLDSYRDAYGQSAYTPDKRLFRALLEGVKRIGDLGRVRWIIAEMVKQSQLADTNAHHGDPKLAVRVDDDIMVHVFHTYAAYKVPFSRSLTPLVEEANPDISKADNPNAKNAVEPEASRAVTQSTSFAYLPPQSKAEVLAEAKALFARIVTHRQLAVDEVDNNILSSKTFRHVRLTPRLLNAYLSIHYAHSTLEDAHNLYSTLFSELGVSKNAWSYVEALERCSIRRAGHNKEVALPFAEQAWKEWRVLEDLWRSSNIHTTSVNARVVERAYVAMIRVLALTKNLDQAVALVKTFVQRYPAMAIRPSTPKHELQSTRTSLLATRPLVRLSSVVDIPDDYVPPLLSFTDVEVLHHRLLAANRAQDINYLKWVCKSYEGSLRARRENALRSSPVKRTHGASADNDS